MVDDSDHSRMMIILTDFLCLLLHFLGSIEILSCVCKPSFPTLASEVAAEESGDKEESNWRWFSIIVINNMRAVAVALINIIRMLPVKFGALLGIKNQKTIGKMSGDEADCFGALHRILD